MTMTVPLDYMLPTFRTKAWEGKMNCRISGPCVQSVTKVLETSPHHHLRVFNSWRYSGARTVTTNEKLGNGSKIDSTVIDSGSITPSTCALVTKTTFPRRREHRLVRVL